jgi:hypothetical protein
MKINVSFISIKHYSKKNIGQWFWMFRRYTLIKGFIVRICGVYINVRERKAFEKLIGIANSRKTNK